MARDLMHASVLQRVDGPDVSESARARRRAAWREHGKLALDAAMLAGGIVLSTVAAIVSNDHVPGLAWLLVYPGLVLLLLVGRGMYVLRLRTDILEEARRILAATALAAMAIITLKVLRGMDQIGYEVVRPWLFTTAYLLAGRVALLVIESRAARRRDVGRRTLIVGAGRVGRLVANRLSQREEYGLRPVGFLDKEPLDDQGADDPPVLGASWDLGRLVGEERIEHVVITFSTAPHSVLTRVANECHELGVGVSVVPRLFESFNDRASLDRLGGVPLLTIRRPNPAGVEFALKYVFDRVMAALLLVLVAPVFAATAIAVWLSTGRPILFRQTRVGRDGKPFEMLKFRTLAGRPETDGEADADWAALQNGRTGSPASVAVDRRTPIGGFLRRYSIDELPQLWNVLVGDMSLIGPRPERLHYVEQFVDSVYRYGERHRVKSGITGWAQVNGLRGKTSLADRVEWDNYYIENWSLWLDVKILLLTCLAVFWPRTAE
jgi:exopolysaccharide biosynthesis polyprenyl glycosylphosphotransferase